MCLGVGARGQPPACVFVLGGGTRGRMCTRLGEAASLAPESLLFLRGGNLPFTRELRVTLASFPSLEFI